eukprot:5743812-Amphidinium_carterae.1
MCLKPKCIQKVVEAAPAGIQAKLEQMRAYISEFFIKYPKLAQGTIYLSVPAHVAAAAFQGATLGARLTLHLADVVCYMAVENRADFDAFHAHLLSESGTAIGLGTCAGTGVGLAAVGYAYTLTTTVVSTGYISGPLLYMGILSEAAVTTTVATYAGPAALAAVGASVALPVGFVVATGYMGWKVIGWLTEEDEGPKEEAGA